MTGGMDLGRGETGPDGVLGKDSVDRLCEAGRKRSVKLGPGRCRRGARAHLATKARYGALAVPLVRT